MHVSRLLFCNVFKTFMVALLLFLIYTTLCGAREYHEEVFLQFPNRIVGCDMKEIKSPGTIVLDNQDRLCYRDGVRIAVYSFAGDIVDEIYLRSETGSVMYGLDFCIDETGNFYALLNRNLPIQSRGEIHQRITITKFDPQGWLIGKMQSAEYHERHLFGGWKITYVQDYGLILSGHRPEHIPVKFEKDRVLDFVYQDNKIDRMMIDKDSYVEAFELGNKSYRLTVYKNGVKIGSVETGREAEKYWTLIPSWDKTYQYYHCWDRDHETRERYSIIRKYDGGELIYSSDRLPGITSGAKSCAVDSYGNIYYCSADERRVTIIRWILQQD